ncbi:hypothetical protein O1R50_04000 [Glycomyces luteolus]|uniref:Uncharacterized protein n=1 Tax=Glycomyces luteolus TaxID=2670330 RepID=A0A9X3P8P4_9ACTN|nr:hypothetical protein [Glycomyces luteolus]MDA1358770.1 hypothetical protein [Glycomyces luteolus]
MDASLPSRKIMPSENATLAAVNAAIGPRAANATVSSTAIRMLTRLNAIARFRALSRRAAMHTPSAIQMRADSAATTENVSAAVMAEDRTSRPMSTSAAMICQGIGRW